MSDLAIKLFGKTIPLQVNQQEDVSCAANKYESSSGTPPESEDCYDNTATATSSQENHNSHKERGEQEGNNNRVCVFAICWILCLP
jgi:hypothetical protein